MLGLSALTSSLFFYQFQSWLEESMDDYRCEFHNKRLRMRWPSISVQTCRLKCPEWGLAASFANLRTCSGELLRSITDRVRLGPHRGMPLFDSLAEKLLCFFLSDPLDKSLIDLTFGSHVPTPSHQRHYSSFFIILQANNLEDKQASQPAKLPESQ